MSDLSDANRERPRRIVPSHGVIKWILIYCIFIYNRRAISMCWRTSFGGFSHLKNASFMCSLRHGVLPTHKDNKLVKTVIVGRQLQLHGQNLPQQLRRSGSPTHMSYFIQQPPEVACDPGRASTWHPSPASCEKQTIREVLTELGLPRAR